MDTTLTSKCTIAGAVAAPRRKTAPERAIAPLADLFSTWLDRTRQRRSLYALDERMLKDIGLSRADVESETRKYFWMR